MMVITMTAFSSRKILLTSFLGVTFSLLASDAFAAEEAKIEWAGDDEAFDKSFQSGPVRLEPASPSAEETAVQAVATEEDLRTFMATTWKEGDHYISNENIQKEIHRLAADPCPQKTSFYRHSLSIFQGYSQLLDIKAPYASFLTGEGKEPVLVEVRSRKKMLQMFSDPKTAIILGALDKLESRYSAYIAPMQEPRKREEAVKRLEQTFSEIQNVSAEKFTDEQMERIKTVLEKFAKNFLGPQVEALDSAAAGKP